MKKREEMRDEYRHEDLGKGVRGKHFAEFRKGSNLVLLTPGSEDWLHDSRAVAQLDKALTWARENPPADQRSGAIMKKLRSKT